MSGIGGEVAWGNGAAGFALWMACQACAIQGASGRGGILVVVDPRGWCYPPTLTAWGVDWKRICLVRPASWVDQLWVVDQALRCPAVAAVWAEFDRLPPRPFRRLQLAAEQGSGWGVLVRPARARGEPSWASVRLVVQPRRTPIQPIQTSHTSHTSQSGQSGQSGPTSQVGSDRLVPSGWPAAWPLRLQRVGWRSSGCRSSAGAEGVVDAADMAGHEEVEMDFDPAVERVDPNG